MDLPKSNSRPREDEEDPFSAVDRPLYEAFRNPNTRLSLITLEKMIRKFILTDFQAVEFLPVHTRYSADITSMLARHYGLEPVLSAESTKFWRTPHTRLSLPTLSSIPPYQPERVKTLKEREEFFKDLGVTINPDRLSSISPVVPHSTSPVQSGMLIEGDQVPNSGSALPSTVAPLSLEPLPSPSSEAAKVSSPGLPLQNQDVVNFPPPMEDEEPNFDARRPPQRRRLTY